MSMQCKVSNRLTPLVLCITTSEEEDMKAVEGMKVVEDTEAVAEVEDRPSAIIVDNKVTSHGTVR